MRKVMPTGWSEATILELGNNHKDTVQTGPFGAQLHASDYISEGVPLILIRNIKDYGLDERNIPKISEDDAKRLSRFRLNAGDIVFSRVGRVGSCFLTTERESGWVISGQTLRMRVDLRKIDPEFLVCELRTDKIQKEIVGESVGSTRTSINTTILENLQVAVPPLPEQQKIATILSSVDKVIETTRAQIDKLKDLKTGMMQELLTKGVGVNGVPHTEFKDSPLGRIPVGWEVEELVNLSINGISNGIFNDPKKVGSGYKIINVYDMYRGFGVDTSALKLINADLKEFQRNKVEYGDVFFTRSSLKLEGIAYCNINLSHDNDITYDGHLMRIRPNQGRVTPKYLAYFCLSDYARKFFMAAAKHSTMTTIGQADISTLKVLLPPLHQQEEIVKVIDSIQVKINIATTKLSNSVALKKALMQDLLTGKVRVKIDEKEKEPAVA